MPARIPLSIGGKLNAKGVIVATSTNQFNGSVDDVFLRATLTLDPQTARGTTPTSR